MTDGQSQTVDAMAREGVLGQVVANVEEARKTRLCCKNRVDVRKSAEVFQRAY